MTMDYFITIIVAIIPTILILISIFFQLKNVFVVAILPIILALVHSFFQLKEEYLKKSQD